MELRGIDLRALRLVRVEVAETETAKRTPFKLGKWSMHAENFRNVEFSWLDSMQAYEVAGFQES
jgi:hypothetical protein